MKKINLSEVPTTVRKSPKGNFNSHRLNISMAMGREPDSLDLAKRHPFDLALVRVQPGASLCPYHEHSAQWELYVFVSGHGIMRSPDGEHEVSKDDVLLFPHGEAHKLTNPGPEELIYYIIADNPVGDSCYYPDSDKFSVEKARESMIIRGGEKDYFDGEE